MLTKPVCLPDLDHFGPIVTDLLKVTPVPIWNGYKVMKLRNRRVSSVRLPPFLRMRKRSPNWRRRWRGKSWRSEWPNEPADSRPCWPYVSTTAKCESFIHVARQHTCALCFEVFPFLPPMCKRKQEKKREHVTRIDWDSLSHKLCILNMWRQTSRWLLTFYRQPAYLHPLWIANKLILLSFIHIAIARIKLFQHRRHTQNICF